MGLRALEGIPGASEERVILQSDSKYLCDAFNRGWISKLASQRLDDCQEGAGEKPRPMGGAGKALTRGKTITWSWVKGHRRRLLQRALRPDRQRGGRDGRQACPWKGVIPGDTGRVPGPRTAGNACRHPARTGGRSLRSRNRIHGRDNAGPGRRSSPPQPDAKRLRGLPGNGWTEFEKTIQWSELIHGGPPASSPGTAGGAVRTAGRRG